MKKGAAKTSKLKRKAASTNTGKFVIIEEVLKCLDKLFEKKVCNNTGALELQQ